jgi:hypothetical protein
MHIHSSADPVRRPSPRQSCRRLRRLTWAPTLTSMPPHVVISKWRWSIWLPFSRTKSVLRFLNGDEVVVRVETHGPAVDCVDHKESAAALTTARGRPRRRPTAERTPRPTAAGVAREFLNALEPGERVLGAAELEVDQGLADGAGDVAVDGARDGELFDAVADGADGGDDDAGAAG